MPSTSNKQMVSGCSLSEKLEAVEASVILEVYEEREKRRGREEQEVGR